LETLGARAGNRSRRATAAEAGDATPAVGGDELRAGGDGAEAVGGRVVGDEGGVL